ncbi:MAG: hypothetical protein MI866_09795 [Bacteroidales bacterium]|nr:hypothetical protein [Bacteroidales bacterium]
MEKGLNYSLVFIKIVELGSVDRAALRMYLLVDCKVPASGLLRINLAVSEVDPKQTRSRPEGG